MQTVHLKLYINMKTLNQSEGIESIVDYLNGYLQAMSDFNDDHSKEIYWFLMAPFFEDGYCFAQPFELPEEFTWVEVDQWLKFPEKILWIGIC